MRVAIIDLGTNSVRFDVHRIGPGNEVRQLHREKLLVRLGQGVFLSGKLDPNAVRRTLQAFVSFQRTASHFHANKIIAFGTSALRESTEGERLLRRIHEKTGIEVKVISGEEEARFIAQGILNNESGLKGRYALLEIGGGSTEISICDDKEILHSTSFALGAARLQQIFLKKSPPNQISENNKHPIDELRRYIKSIVLSKAIAEDWPKVSRVIGSSGTIRAYGRILKKSKSKKTFSLGELSKLIRSMSTMTTTELLALPGLEAKRVDMILAGGILLEESLRCLGANKVQITDYSLRDGILDEEVRLLRQHKGSHIAFHLSDLYAKAMRLGVDEVHLKQVTRMAEILFDKMRPLHKLNSQWKLYLTAAAILHDTGEAITPSNHGLHSYYIVKNADFPSMEHWESEFVAQLCLRHGGGKVTADDLSFTKIKAHRQAYRKLLAILRIADAFDRGHRGGIQVQKIRMAPNSVKIYISSKNSVDLEILRVEQKKDLFEDVFGRHLFVEQVSTSKAD